MLFVPPSLATTVSELCVCTYCRVDGDGDAVDALEMRAERDVAAGEEVLHSYGTHGAAELLRTYGGWCTPTCNVNGAVEQALWRLARTQRSVSLKMLYLLQSQLT